MPWLDRHQSAEPTAEHKDRPDPQRTADNEQNDTKPANSIAVERPQILPIAVSWQIGEQQPEQSQGCDDPRIFIPPFPGSNPGAPASQSLFLRGFMVLTPNAREHGACARGGSVSVSQSRAGSSRFGAVSAGKFRRLVFGSADQAMGTEGQTSARPTAGRASDGADRESVTVSANRAIGRQPVLDRPPQLLVHDRLVLTRIRDALVYGLAPIDAVLQEW